MARAQPSPGCARAGVRERTLAGDETLMNDGRALDRLLSAAGSQRSGEFIFATPSVEVHVFLASGRVAWATDTAHPFEFSRFLKERCQIDDASFREVVEECRRTRVPLGETLVAWELSTWDDVRASLRHQVELALRTLGRESRGETIFLARSEFTRYDDRLTFALAELVADAPARAPSSAPPSAPITVREPTRLVTSAAALREAAHGAAAWARLEREGVLDVDGTAAEGSSPPASVVRVLADGADFVAVRSADRSLVGARREGDDATAWLELEDDAAYRFVLAALEARGFAPAVTGARPEPAAIPSDDPVGWREGALGGAWGEEILQVFAYGADVRAVLALDGAGLVRAAMGRKSVVQAAAVDLVRRRRAVFAEHTFEAGALTALGFRSRTLVTSERDTWCFGGETLDPGATGTVWVVLRREASQGVGWACLTALLRGLRPPAA